MSKTRLVDFIAKENNVTEEEAKNAVEMVLAAIPAVTRREKDWRLTLQNFGAFSIRRREATRRRNPKTGESFIAPAKHTWDYDPATAIADWAAAIPLTEQAGDKFEEQVQ